MTMQAVEWLLLDRALAFLSLAMATCVVYDHITTLDEEVELVWKREKWNAVQILFFINRYTGDLVQM
ncbi:hypothetical protein GALMADRAFT_929285 [Galerina marginata CBS 339.88]|uniref:DUF6533 domain-containing protein n=1 Tax=Galerina marginata (strain CBS 339.88) TaxID=685588 RepID=A0A067SH41_GALM3|nr:hypothetical protein GALMADRAFT_929285 [Galerina marginata CBS 339.88]